MLDTKQEAEKKSTRRKRERAVRAVESKKRKKLLEMKVERRALEDINAGLVSDRRVLFSDCF